jgi:hypothetical protein
VLVECGLVRVTAGDGEEITFAPSLGRIAALASPPDLVELFARLHGPKAEAAAADVLAGLCDPACTEALPALIGQPEATSTGVRWQGGVMPPDERVILARHLLQHGMVGKARPDAKGAAKAGQYAKRFDVAEYIAAARVHLGMSAADAEALSMTEFQTMLEMKVPEQVGGGRRDVPTAEEYEAGMKAFEELKARRAAGKADHA